MSSNTFTLRRVNGTCATDAMMLRNIAEETFTEAFAASNTPETIAAYMSTAFTLKKITAELANSQSSFFFVESAETDSSIMGYLKMNRGGAQSVRDLPNAMEVERIYVRSKYQGLGCGKALMLHAINAATAAKMDWLWLGVWNQNLKAIWFYKSFGFTEFSQKVFRMGDELQSDIMMKMAIVH